MLTYLIKEDSGNITNDIIRTILSYSESELEEFLKQMYLEVEYDEIVSHCVQFRYMDENTFKQVEKIKSGKIYNYGYEIVQIEDLIDYAEEDIIKNNLENKKKWEDIIEKIHIKDKYFSLFITEEYDEIFYRRLYDILNSEEVFQKFITEQEPFKDDPHTKEEYVIKMSELLGKREKTIDYNNKIYRYRFIKKDMLDRYEKLRDMINVDILLLGDTPFGEEGWECYYSFIQEMMDNDWNIDQELLEEVLEGIEKYDCIEEKIAHVYIRLCDKLRYDNRYSFYKYGTGYQKERQEAISLENNAVICGEFSKTFTKIVNCHIEDEEEFEARYVGNILRGHHEKAGIIIPKKNIRIDFEALNIENYFNDFGRVKLGIPMQGVEYICDRHQRFKTAFKTVYQRLLKEKQIEVEDLVLAYQTFSSKETTLDFNLQFEQYLLKYKNSKLKGNEMINMFLYLNHLQYFGPITFAFVGIDNISTFKSRNKIRSITERLEGLEEAICIQSQDQLYLFRVEQYELLPITKEEMNQLFKEDKMKYTDEDYQIDGIGGKRC